MRKTIQLLALLTALTTCKQDQVDPRSVPALEGEYLQMIVEIPAGTNQKIEFDYNDGTFKVDQIDGKDRVIDFLPYPGNYGFIPNTLMDKERGGDGDALDILVIGESVATGTALPGGFPHKKI